MGSEVLLVDDDTSVQEATALLLERAGFGTAAAGDGAAALELFAARPFVLVILDLMLPAIDGLEVCQRIRETSNVPIIILTARGDSAEIVAGLECGADDYITKPFDADDLVARIRAVLQRAAPIEPPTVLHIDGMLIDTATLLVQQGGHPVRLSSTEFRLLLELARHPHRVVTRADLLRDVWGYEYLGDSRLVDMAVARLRDKLSRSGPARDPIEPVPGVGYRFTGG